MPERWFKIALHRKKIIPTGGHSQNEWQNFNALNFPGIKGASPLYKTTWRPFIPYKIKKYIIPYFLAKIVYFLDQPIPLLFYNIYIVIYTYLMTHPPHHRNVLIEWPLKWVCLSNYKLVKKFMVFILSRYHSTVLQWF